MLLPMLDLWKTEAAPIVYVQNQCSVFEAHKVRDRRYSAKRLFKFCILQLERRLYLTTSTQVRKHPDTLVLQALIYTYSLHVYG